MDLSIIIPCHNLEHFITPLLVSLQLQNLSGYKVELIFVCDSCEDNTKQIIENFNFRDKYNVIIIEREVHSCGLARNEGFKEATGQYIWFVDGDDWLIDVDAIAKIIQKFKRMNSPIICFDYGCPDFFKFKGYFSMVWQYSFHKKFIENIPFQKIQPSEDVFFMEEVFNKLKTNKIPTIEEPLYYYNYLRPNSNMQQYMEKGEIQ